MDNPTRNRAELKSYFVKNSIPTERNFAELIDGMLNQKDDGVAKLPGNPLSIEATGDAASEKKALNIYASFGDQNPAWTLSLNPRSNTADPATAKLGLGISDGDGRSRLFIDRNTGNVGIGTTTPRTKLEVDGPLAINTTANLDPARFNIAPLEVNGGLLGWNRTGGEGEIDLISLSGSGSDGGFAFIDRPKGGPDNVIMRLKKNGAIGIGKTDPRTALDTGAGILSGAANDYQKTQHALSGGGTVTWAGGRLKWSNRFIAISMERSVTFAAGHMNIYQPTTNIPAAQVYDGVARTADANGVALTAWEALYAIHTVGSSENAVSFQIVRYTNAFYAPSNWVLVAVVNDDDKTIKLGTGQIVAVNSSSSYGALVPTGAIMMWSGQTTNVPGGWALCDGGNGTPDLRNRFIVAAGGNYAPGNTGGADSVVLSIANLPPHNHANGNYSKLLQVRADGNATAGSADTTHGEPDVLTSADIQTVGSSSAHENRPPYYALAFIMKL